MRASFQEACVNLVFLDGSAGEESACNSGDTGDVDSTPGWEDLLGRKWQLLQCSCLGNFKDRGAQWATAHGVSESDMTEHVALAKFNLIISSKTLSPNTLRESGC